MSRIRRRPRQWTPAPAQRAATAHPGQCPQHAVEVEDGPGRRLPVRRVARRRLDALPPRQYRRVEDPCTPCPGRRSPSLVEADPPVEPDHVPARPRQREQQVRAPLPKSIVGAPAAARMRPTTVRRPPASIGRDSARPRSKSCTTSAPARTCAAGCAAKQSASFSIGAPGAGSVRQRLTRANSRDACPRRGSRRPSNGAQNPTTACSSPARRDEADRLDSGANVLVGVGRPSASTSASVNRSLDDRADSFDESTCRPIPCRSHDVGEHDGRVDAVPAHRCDVTSARGCGARDIPEEVTLADRAVSATTARLAHEPRMRSTGLRLAALTSGSIEG